MGGSCSPACVSIRRRLLFEASVESNKSSALCLVLIISLGNCCNTKFRKRGERSTMDSLRGYLTKKASNGLEKSVAFVGSLLNGGQPPSSIESHVAQMAAGEPEALLLGSDETKKAKRKIAASELANEEVVKKSSKLFSKPASSSIAVASPKTKGEEKEDGENGVSKIRSEQKKKKEEQANNKREGPENFANIQPEKDGDNKKCGRAEKESSGCDSTSSKNSSDRKESKVVDEPKMVDYKEDPKPAGCDSTSSKKSPDGKESKVADKSKKVDYKEDSKLSACGSTLRKMRSGRKETKLAEESKEVDYKEDSKFLADGTKEKKTSASLTGTKRKREESPFKKEKAQKCTFDFDVGEASTNSRHGKRMKFRVQNGVAKKREQIVAGTDGADDNESVSDVENVEIPSCSADWTADLIVKFLSVEELRTYVPGILAIQLMAENPHVWPGDALGGSEFKGVLPSNVWEPWVESNQNSPGFRDRLLKSTKTLSGAENLLDFRWFKRVDVVDEEALKRGDVADEKALERGDVADEKALKRGDVADEKALKRGDVVDEKALKRGDVVDEEGLEHFLMKVEAIIHILFEKAKLSKNEILKFVRAIVYDEFHGKIFVERDEKLYAGTKFKDTDFGAQEMFKVRNLIYWCLHDIESHGCPVFPTVMLCQKIKEQFEVLEDKDLLGESGLIMNYYMEVEQPHELTTAGFSFYMQHGTVSSPSVSVSI